MYFELSKVLSYNAYLNIIIGERGVGKTYSVSKFVTKKFIDNGDEFAYIRRSKEELKKSVPKFFKALNKNNEFPKHKLNSPSFESFTIDNKTAGYGLSLRASQSYKSSNFSKVKYIIFDEFISEDGIYLKNEVHKFFSLIETIARLRDDVVIFLLANSCSISNPYFLELNLSLPYNSQFKTFKDGLILVHYSKNEVYRETKKNTKFGKLIEGSDFENFAINNQFIFDNSTFIAKKTKHASCYFAFSYQNNTYGVWNDFSEGKMFISSDYIDNVPLFATTIENHSPNTMLISSAKYYKCWKKLLDNYKYGNVFFENQKIKNASMEVIKMFLR